MCVLRRRLPGGITGGFAASMPAGTRCHASSVITWIVPPAAWWTEISDSSAAKKTSMQLEAPKEPQTKSRM